MFKKISWMALTIGLAARIAVSTALATVFYFFLGRFMLMMGTPALFLWERYRSSPLGILCGSVAALAGSVALGFAIGKFLKVKTLAMVNIAVFLVLELVVFFLASGLNVPGYRYVSASAGELVIHVFTIAAVFFGGLAVTYKE